MLPSEWLRQADPADLSRSLQLCFITYCVYVCYIHVFATCRPLTCQPYGSCHASLCVRTITMAWAQPKGEPPSQQPSTHEVGTTVMLNNNGALRVECSFVPQICSAHDPRAVKRPAAAQQEATAKTRHSKDDLSLLPALMLHRGLPCCHVYVSPRAASCGLALQDACPALPHQAISALALSH